MFRYKYFLLPMFCLCLSCNNISIREKEIYLIPVGFTGRASIRFNIQHGITPPKRGDSIFYIIPENGVLNVQTSLNTTWKLNSNISYIYYNTHNGKFLKHLIYYPHFDTFPKDSSIFVSSIHAGNEMSVNKNDGKQFTYLSFLVADAYHYE